MQGPVVEQCRYIQLRIMVDMNTHRCPSVFPPPFARAWGDDQYGLWAEFEVTGSQGVVTQRCRWIEPGTFLMGSPEDERERSRDETLHTVTLTQGYWLADTACTQGLWLAIMGDNPSFFSGTPENPVESVSWRDVQAFLSVLNDQVQSLFATLPTEAQWEYACRAGTTTPFSFGTNITPELVNYDGRYPYANGKEGVYRGKTVPVKSFPPNAWGLYEMHGNVYEWCADRYGAYSLSSKTDPVGSTEGNAYVRRGGLWDNHARVCRSADRSKSAEDRHSSALGFRLVLGQNSIRLSGKTISR